MLIRILDIILSLIGITIGSPIALLIFIVGLFDTGAPIFFQKRLGQNRCIFTLVKFRTMLVQTESVASHLVEKSSITLFGSFLRRSKLDELPQLWNVLTGDMSFVGPRPCLPNQYDVINARAALGVLDFKPGITGLSQILRIDMSTPELLAANDARMMRELNLWLYFKIIIQTITGSGFCDPAQLG